jgi:hypothetical protein
MPDPTSRTSAGADAPVVASVPAGNPDSSAAAAGVEATRTEAAHAVEIGGPEGLEPTRYGDWERRGRCIDF